MNHVNDKQKENAQVQANMKVVHNILNGGTIEAKGTYAAPELAVAA